LLQQLDNDLTRAVDFWVNTIVEGYIIEFVIERYQSFLETEVVFKSILGGRLMRDVSLWIKMFMVEE